MFSTENWFGKLLVPSKPSNVYRQANIPFIIFNYSAHNFRMRIEWLFHWLWLWRWLWPSGIEMLIEHTELLTVHWKCMHNDVMETDVTWEKWCIEKLMGKHWNLYAFAFSTMTVKIEEKYFARRQGEVCSRSFAQQYATAMDRLWSWSQAKPSKWIYYSKKIFEIRWTYMKFISP